MRFVNVNSVSNAVFTFLVPLLPLGRLTVESFNAAILPERQGRRVVAIQDLACLQFPEFHPWPRRVLFRRSVRRTARQADAIIVPSPATSRDFAARFPGAEGKTHMVPLAPGERFVPLRLEQSRPVFGRYGLSYRDYLLFVGNVEPRKNLRALLDAYTRMRTATGLSRRLAIAGGRGWKNHPIHQAAAASPFAAEIRFLGHVPETDLPALAGARVPVALRRVRLAAPGGHGVRDARGHVEPLVAA